MIERTIAQAVKQSVRQVPVVTIIGPRQAGKTTLVKELFPDFTYVNLEDKATRELAQSDYIGFFTRYPEPLIIAEVQRVPELLSALQVRVDEHRGENGRFILTGSHQPHLMEAVSQSLAGRTAIHTLFPLSLEEIQAAGRAEDVDETILRGFMPELYRPEARDPNAYYRDYLQTYIEKDLRSMIGIKDLNAFLRFLTLLAGRVGQVVNLSGLSS